MTDQDIEDDSGIDPDRAAGTLLGLAVGDALGTTLEFSKRDKGPVVTDMVGGGPFGLKPGQWTDDTSMALCLAESLIDNHGHLEPQDLMARFSRWYRDGENSVTGRCFDIGTITRSALEHFARSGETAAASPPDPQQAGNGTLMRLAPVAIVAAPEVDRAALLADEQSRTTHRAELAHEACRLFAVMLVEAMTGASKEHVLRVRVIEGPLASLAAGSWRGKPREEIVSSGYVLATLEASLWCVGETETFADAVLLAANLGDDADTVAAVTGQLAGALYGRAAIPAAWLDRLAWRDRIEALAVKLQTAGSQWRSSRARFTWSEGDVVMYDADGNVITPRQARELQLERSRAEVEEDLPADSAGWVDPALAPPSADPSSTASKISAETLLTLGFVDVASWNLSGDRIAYGLDGPHAEANRLRLEETNALYAFVRRERVLYIGKTARTIRKRFTGYCRPDRGQRTNWRCNGKIREILTGGGEVRIFVFNPIL